MDKRYYALVTDLGRSLITQALAHGESITPNTFAVGDGGGGYYAPDGTETDLRGEFYRGAISQTEVQQDRITITAPIPSTVSGTVREIGLLYDGQLVVIANFPEIVKEPLAAGGVYDFVLHADLHLQSTEGLMVYISPGMALATVEQLNNKQAIHDIRLQTAAKTVVDAINEVRQAVTEIDPGQHLTSADVLRMLKTVDGAGSGLDADTLDGKQATEFAPAVHSHDAAYYTKDQVDGIAAGKSSTGHTHPYAGAATAGGDANNALKINGKALGITFDAASGTLSFTW